MNGQTTQLEPKLAQPKALYGLGLTFTFERFAYYGGKPILVLFLSWSIARGGLGISKADAAIIAANLGAFTYLAPIFGGIIADRWLGTRYCIILGTILMAIGWTLGYFATSVAWINALIIVVSIGTGFFKGNLNALVGDLYEKDDPRKDMGYSITYSFVNIGAFVGSIALGAIYLTHGFRLCYLLAGIFALISGIVFLFTCRGLGDLGKRPNKYAIDSSKEKEDAKVDVNRPLTKRERNQVIVILILALFTVFFWIFYNQAEGSLLLYIDQFINFSVGSLTIPATWTTTSFNSLICIILAPVMAAFWMKLSKKRKNGDLTMTQKIALGYILLGIGFLVMAVAEIVRGGRTTASLSMMWILMFTLFQSLGEICFSPLGNSVVSKNAPPKYLALLMGVWSLATFVSQKAAGYVQGIIENLGTLQVFIAIPCILFVGAIILFACNKKITELTE